MRPNRSAQKQNESAVPLWQKFQSAPPRMGRLGERGLSISHTTILRWVIRYAETCEKRWNRFERQVGGSWVRRRRPCFKHSRRPIHDGIFNRNSDHPNLSPLLAERISKRPMRGSPRAEFTIRLVARIDVGKGDDFRVHGKDRRWRGTR